MNPSDRTIASPAMADTKLNRAPKRRQADRPAAVTKKAKHPVPAKQAAPAERGTKNWPTLKNDQRQSWTDLH